MCRMMRQINMKTGADSIFESAPVKSFHVIGARFLKQKKVVATFGKG